VNPELAANPSRRTPLPAGARTDPLYDAPMNPRRHAVPRRALATALAALGVVGVAGESLAAASAPAPTKAQAKSFATAVNLRRGDVPGFKLTPAEKTTAADRKMAASVASCAGGVAPARAVIDADSPDFSLASGIVQQDISSEVEVLPTTALVAKDFAAVISKRGRTCLEHALQKGFDATKVAGVKFGKVSVLTKTVQANGASASFALRFVITATIRGQKIPYYSDFLGFTLGQAEVTLSALGFDQPVSDSDELGLFSLLLRRAEAAQL
jgi:hypothetical protein